MERSKRGGGRGGVYFPNAGSKPAHKVKDVLLTDISTAAFLRVEIILYHEIAVLHPANRPSIPRPLHHPASPAHSPRLCALCTMGGTVWLGLWVKGGERESEKEKETERAGYEP